MKYVILLAAAIAVLVCTFGLMVVGVSYILGSDSELIEDEDLNET